MTADGAPDTRDRLVEVALQPFRDRGPEWAAANYLDARTITLIVSDVVDALLDSGEVVPAAEHERIRSILDQPDPTNFVGATEIEMRYQQAHWGEEHDAEKNHEDWYWLVGYLAGKALHRREIDGHKKFLHRLTALAAAVGNWHRHARRALDGEEPDDG